MSAAPDRGSPEEQLAEAMRAAGIVPPLGIRLDGRLRRFASDGKKGGDKAGWYVGHRDGVPAGRFGCWRQGISQAWHAVGQRPLTAAEELEVAKVIEGARIEREAEQERRQEVASDVAEQIWESLPEAMPTHPYLERKGIKPHGARVTGDGRLVVPLFSDDWEMTSLQYIDREGDKKYHPSGKTQGSFWILGELALEADGTGTVYVAEGFATAATIHEVTGAPVVVAYSASNLVPVVGGLRERHGAKTSIVVVADNDKSGLGQRYAEQAAAKHGARVVVPPILGDANDYVQAGRDLGALLSPKADDGWLVSADDFASQPAPISWLIRGWLQSSALVMVHGPSGLGKTFVVLDWCLSMASSLPSWHGAKVKPGGVVYLAGEGHHGLRGRVAAWKQHHGVTSTNMWLSRAGCDLDKPEGLRKVIDHVTSLPSPPALIVVDTLHRFLSGDENSALDTKAMLDSCAALMSTFGCSVLLVHHTGNAEEAQKRARGSSAWRGALDIEVSITRASGDEDVIEISQRKSKDAEITAPVHAQLKGVAITGWVDEDGEDVTSAVLAPTEAPPTRERPTKESKRLAEHKRTWERAWWHTGAEVFEGRPYISRSGMRDYLVTAEGMSEKTADQRLRPSDAPGRVLRDLVDGHIVQEWHHGWCVTDDGFSSVLLLSKGGT